MALQRDTKYPGRFTTATTAHPQGPFKNRTSSTSQDGSYLEKDWLNDWDGFFGSLLSNAGLTPDGNVDAVGASQYYTALSTILSTNFNRTLLTTPVGASRNLKCSMTAASATSTFTADELVVGTSLSGSKYHISSLNKSITLTTTGAGGMDTGSAPVSGYVAIYAIYNPATQTSALLGYNATSVVAPEVYGGSNMPSGYTASALISVWPTNSSGLMIIGYQQDRTLSFAETFVVTATAASSGTSLSIASTIPKNAKSISGRLYATATSGSGGVNVDIAADSAGVVTRSHYAYSTGGVVTIGAYADLPILTAQKVWYSFNAVTASAWQWGITVGSYKI